MSTLTDAFAAIANAIRLKKGVTTKYTPAEMPDAIASIEADTSDATAVQGDILASKTAYIATGKVTGGMVNRGAVQINVGVNETYAIQEGYHNGMGKISGAKLSGDASESDVISGKTFYSDSGTKLTGTIATRSASSETIRDAKTYSSGYYSSNWTLTPDIRPFSRKGTIGVKIDEGYGYGRGGLKAVTNATFTIFGWNAGTQRILWSAHLYNGGYNKNDISVDTSSDIVVTTSGSADNPINSLWYYIPSESIMVYYHIDYGNAFYYCVIGWDL